MKKRHALWYAIGPVLIAAVVTVLLLVVPHRTPTYKQGELEKASLSMSNNVLKGQAMKTQALNNGYVPFFGSSELARLDMMHPSVLAAKYHRDYRPFLLGRAGTQSLTHYFAMQDMTAQLKNRKAVVILSPQWFTKVGQVKAAFAMYYSPLATAQWLLKARNTATDRYAAKRLLQMHTVHKSSVMHQAVWRIAHGRRLTAVQRGYLHVRLRLLQSEDRLFAKLGIKDKRARLKKSERQLPAQYSVAKLNQLAGDAGRKHTTSNRFQIDNHLYQQKLSHGRVKRLKNQQRHFDYRRSPEYGDFELLLNQFKQSNTNVLFVLPPVNDKWAKYTGLSLKMLRSTNHKIKQQLTAQGFTNVLDLSEKGNVNYFMQDTIHLGWRGWLAVDQAVKPFLTKQQAAPHYRLKNYYYSKKWQQKLIN
ncbi:D-alanyl-lipoteichoic acid biosynthesis protein DltD [Secundilactobacillus similis]|uniref:Protein DltD n=1 Tax=Secundilactobacillus similis DSM 23365 = JCM 2765 TaxID=1423804 RepID=A0A0R2EUK6_9LACO|nr:D-alanyl-lipoteichoic acid biosynthesis protein DltD [Secundilactobacillus similis]KRN15949.1 extramembranal transfer protein [Secundilactobacillus similis DSM 23365 = JCM 2765]